MNDEFKVQSPKSKVQKQISSSDSGLWTLDSEPTAPSPPILNPQSWQCLSVSVPYEVTEVVADFLIELGSEGVIESERDLTQPESSITTVQGFFPLTRSHEQLFSALAQYLQRLTGEFPHLGEVKPHLSEITSDTWSHQWRGHFPPLPVGQRFLVLPPWESSTAWPERIALVINPSMAFGTGHHATTQGCLEAIEDLYRQYGPPLRVLDLGTGSGILAIALVKLEAQEVWATDIDPIALEEAQKNAIANQVAQSICLKDVTVELLPLPFTLIVANLFSSTLISLAPTLAAAVAPQGHAILSGIQLDQEADVLAAYTTPLWQLMTRYPKDEWVTLVFQRSS